MRPEDYIPHRIRHIVSEIVDRTTAESILINHLNTLRNKQTFEEQIERVALYNNAEGFNFPDSSRVMAIMDTIKENGGHIPMGLFPLIHERLVKYARQLAFIANMKVFKGFQTPCFVWNQSGGVYPEYRDIVYADTTRYAIRSIEAKRHDVMSLPGYTSGRIVDDEDTKSTGYLMAGGDQVRLAKGDVPVKTPEGACTTIRDYMTYCDRTAQLSDMALIYQG